MKYVCYLSETKLSQVLAHADAGYEEVENTLRETAVEGAEGDIAVGLRVDLDVISAGASASGRKEYEREVRRAFKAGKLAKLARALDHLDRHQGIPNLADELHRGKMPVGQHVHLTADFRVTDTDRGTIQISTRVAGYELRAACSLANFSHLRPDGSAATAAIDSMNYYFLAGKTPAWLSGLFIVTYNEQLTVYSSPLYLVYQTAGELRL